MRMIKELKNIKCCGCSSCYNICPVGAIVMQENNEGFLYPLIDDNKCINCGLCAKSCPVLNVQYKNKPNPICHAVMASDEIRYNSSSGGVFPVLAYNILKKGGFVAGAIWCNNGCVKHIVSNKGEDIEKMRGSKYLQSNIGSCYAEIKNLLKQDKEILFTGTPCQVAGLKTYLQKDYKKLYTIEVICHGTPSPKAFKKYLEQELEISEEFISTNFRNKSNGWSHKLLITTKTNQRTIENSNKEHSFFKAFSKNICLRESCGDCTFNKMPRQADITIGDFWGVWEYNEKLDDKKGTSIVLLNNKKGEKLFKCIKKEFKLTHNVPFKKACVANPNLKNSSKIHSNRKEFFELLDKKSFDNALEYSLNDKADCLILNYWYAINYGAALTCYGVQCLAEKFGLNAKIINYIPKFKKDYPDSFSEKFAKKYLKLTTPVKNYNDFIKLNNKTELFITGSDQVWSPKHIIKHCKNAIQSIYLLDFVEYDKKKISYAASFGVSEFQGDSEQKVLFKHFIKQFDAISVREDDGINILSDLGISNATQLLDGAFLIPKVKLEEMTKDYHSNEKYIACFVLPYFKEQCWYKELLPKIEEYLNITIKPFDFDKKTSVEEWLAYIKNSEFVITDSFHGFVFSLIFNRPFVQIKNAKCQSRFESMFRLLNIEDNSIAQNEKLDLDKIFIERNWSEINKKIEEEINKAENWFKNAITKSTKDKSEYTTENYLLIKSQLEKQELKKFLNILKNYRKTKFKYKLCKVLKMFAIGKKRKELKNKIKEYEKLLKSI